MIWEASTLKKVTCRPRPRNGTKPSLRSVSYSMEYNFVEFRYLYIEPNVRGYYSLNALGSTLCAPLSVSAEKSLLNQGTPVRQFS